MSYLKEEDPNPEEQNQKEQESEPVIDEEFEKKQEREKEIIDTVIDGVFTFFL